MTKQGLYRQIIEASARKAGDSVAVLVVFPPTAFANAPYWTPGPGFRICMPNRTWHKDNRDGTVDIMASYVTPKIGISAWDGGDWTEPELWTVRTPADNERLTTILWDKPHRITHFLEPSEEEKEGILPPSHVIDRVSHQDHPITAVLEYWDDFSVGHGFIPRRLEDVAGLEAYYGLLTHWKPTWSSDLQGTHSLSALVYKVTKIAHEFHAEVHILG